MIRVLTKDISDKIAAGEVVDRPLSIVKELVENSIDAGASSISVEIKKGGKEYIRVTDNGCGIASEEALLAFRRHATSKITTDKDLESISTLGFRGEALSSISAVARVELITKPSEEKAGSKTIIKGGEVWETGAVGCPDGTTMVITDLFYNTPARYKFLKSDSAESSLIIDFISQIALAYPDIKLRMTNNESVLFSTNGRGDRYNNILAIYGKDLASGLAPVLGEQDYLSLRGYVSGPKTSRASRRNQIIFVNGRVISSKVIDKAIADAYADRLFAGRFPVVFLFLSSAPGMLDVNIHPNKREVRFDDENKVREFITRAIQNGLAAKSAIPEMKKDDIFKFKNVQQVTTLSSLIPQGKEQEKEKELVNEEESFVDDNNLSSTKDGETPKENISIKLHQDEQVNINNILSTYRSEAGHTSARKDSLQLKEDSISYLEQAMPATPPKPFEFSKLSLTGAVFGTYITAVDEDSFYFIDQHAAHERIFYERLMDQYKCSEKLKQSILLPFTVDVPFAIKASQSDWLTVLGDMGFEIDEFGPKTYIVKAVPMFMEISEAQNFINYFLDNLGEAKGLENIVKLQKIASNACKSAVKAHDILSESERQQLVLDLAKCENPFSCPHGRPTFIKLSIHEIEKMFKRV